MSTTKEPANRDTQAACLILQTFLLFGPMTIKEFRFIWEILGVLKKQWNSNLFQWSEVHGDGVWKTFEKELRGYLVNNSDKKGKEKETIYHLHRDGQDSLLEWLENYEVPIIYNDSGKDDREIIKEMIGVNLRNKLAERVINFLVHGLTEEKLIKKIKLRGDFGIVEVDA